MSRRIRSVGVWVVVFLAALCAALALAVRAGEIRGVWVKAHRDVSRGAGGHAGQALDRSGPIAGGTLAPLPLYFVENRGQLDQQVAYYVQGKDKTLYFTSQGVTFALSGQAPPVIARSVATTQSRALESRGLLICTCGADRLVPAGRDSRPERDAGVACGGQLAMTEEALGGRWAVKLEFVGANPDVRPIGLDEAGAVISYFKGRPDEWVTGAKAYSKVVYRDLWPGIDLEYYGLVDQLKYQFVVGSGADPSQIRLAYSGATELTVDEAGRLHVATPLGGFEDDAPYAYQQTEDGEHLPVNVSYDLSETLWVSETPGVYYYRFRLGDYDQTKPLILDPTVLNYCGYLGGLGEEAGNDIAIDADGNAYLTGNTPSSEASFPVTVGPDLTFNGDGDAFVAKVRADGSGLVYCGYIGGSDWDFGYGIAVDGSGHAYVSGKTSSDDAEGFPATIGPSLLHMGGHDAFVAKVKPDGTDLLYCGYIGGSGSDAAHAIAVDSSGSVYVAGGTSSSPTDGFPVTVGPSLTYAGSYDAFVAKVRADGRELTYCGYIGGARTDIASAIAVDGGGSAHVAGFTGSSPAQGFPVDVGPDLTYNGLDDGFVAKVQADGAGLAYCGYIGGSGSDNCHDLALDSSGNAYVTGYTSSSETTFPETIGPDLSHNGLSDAFVAKVIADGTGLAYCGYVGGSRDDDAYGIAVDGEGNAHLTGYTWSSEAEGFPVTAGPDLTHNGSTDAFVARVRTDGGGLDYCGYIGGSDGETGRAIALDSDGNAYVAGDTWSSQAERFPVTMGPDVTFNGDADAFVARVGENRAPTLGTVTPSSASSPAGVTVYFITTWKDADGWQDLKQCYFHIGPTASLVGNVTLMYNAKKDKLWMLSDDGTTWLGGDEPGSGAIIENSQARLHVSETEATGETDTLQVRWAIEPKATYTSLKKTGLKCKDAHRAKAKGAWKGTWTIG